jgi:hypothetical protein
MNCETCGAPKDASGDCPDWCHSDGAHAGPCEYEGGYGDWPYDTVRCVKCLAVIHAEKQASK